MGCIYGEMGLVVLLYYYWSFGVDRVNMILYNGLDSHQREVFRVEILTDKWPSDIIELGKIMENGSCRMMAHH